MSDPVVTPLEQAGAIAGVVAFATLVGVALIQRLSKRSDEE